MKKILITSVLVLITLVTYSQSPDTTRDNKSYKLSYEEFQNQYGTDDTSAALIDLFFSKRDEKAFGQMSMLPLSTAVTVVMPPVGIYLMAVSSPIFVNGLIVQLKYSRKKLLAALNGYHQHNMLADNYTQKVVALIELSRENEAEEALQAELDELKTALRAAK